MSKLSRRDWMITAAAAAGGMSFGQALGAAKRPNEPGRYAGREPGGSAPDSLNGIARTKGLRFGSCIGTGPTKGELELLRPEVLARPRRASAYEDTQMRVLTASQCGIVVPENELKFYVLRPRPGVFDFRRADMLMDFASRNHLAMRGHTLFWNRTNWTPRWVNELDFGSRPATAAEKMLREHIFKVCRHYGERIFSYDVINETVNQDTGELEDTVFTKHLGWNVIDICFHAAREAAPHAEMVYNDFPSWGPDGTHRAGLLKLLDYTKKKNLPVDTFGIQAHIGFGNTGGGPGAERDETAWRKFLDEVTAMGFALIITEFDVNERYTQGDVAARDRIVADLGKTYLDIILSYPQLRYVMAWGLVDKYSWLQEFTPRADGLPQRCTPYDDNYQPKPLREAIAAAFAAAPARTEMKIEPA
ncbi:MAG TPA: endo-1,4-beta-xylanase [Rhizomicrobium sp.]